MVINTLFSSYPLISCLDRMDFLFFVFNKNFSTCKKCIYVYLCMHACMYVYVCVYVCMHVHMYVRMYVFMYACMFAGRIFCSFLIVLLCFQFVCHKLFPFLCLLFHEIVLKYVCFYSFLFINLFLSFSSLVFSFLSSTFESLIYIFII